MAEKASYEPTYRQQDVDSTLDEHDNRITRVEKALLIVAGYGLADGWSLVSDVVGLF